MEFKSTGVQIMLRTSPGRQDGTLCAALVFGQYGQFAQICRNPTFLSIEGFPTTQVGVKLKFLGNQKVIILCTLPRNF